MKTLLVLTHRRIIRPSRPAVWRIVGSPNLIIACCSGSRAMECGRPLRATTVLLLIVNEEFITGQSASDFVVTVHPSRCSPCHCSLLQYRTYLADISHQHFLQLRFCGAHAAYCRDQLHVVRVTRLAVRIYDDASACCTGWKQPRLSASSSRVILTLFPCPRKSILTPLPFVYLGAVSFYKGLQITRAFLSSLPTMDAACCASVDIKVFSLLTDKSLYPVTLTCLGDSHGATRILTSAFIELFLFSAKSKPLSVSSPLQAELTVTTHEMLLWLSSDMSRRSLCRQLLEFPALFHKSQRGDARV